MLISVHFIGRPDFLINQKKMATATRTISTSFIILVDNEHMMFWLT